MTAMDEISRTMLQLSHELITEYEAEKIIFHLIEEIRQEAVVEYLAKKLLDTIEKDNITIANSFMAVRRCLDKLGGR